MRRRCAPTKYGEAKIVRNETKSKLSLNSQGISVIINDLSYNLSRNFLLCAAKSIGVDVETKYKIYKTDI